MSVKVIVTGHGHFATGLESTVKLLAGRLPDVGFIDFTGDMDETSLRKKFEQAIRDTDQIVFFCDLLGGTPFKEAVKINSTVADKKIAVVTGCNIGSLMELGLQLNGYTGTVDELAQKFVDISRAQTQVFHRRKIETNGNSDGI